MKKAPRGLFLFLVFDVRTFTMPIQLLGASDWPVRLSRYLFRISTWHIFWLQRPPICRLCIKAVHDAHTLSGTPNAVAALRVSHLVIRHQLKGNHECGMVELARAVRGTGLHERRSPQRY
jgi:hypothetical protein